VSETPLWPWLVLLLLGAFHGINPGMGWLFAVALGLQEQRRQAVFWALLPIALGHAASVAAVVLLVGFAQLLLPESLLRLLGALILGGVGGYRLIRARHPRWVGMRVSFWDLIVWSFFMASAHGAGLVLVPVLLQWSPEAYAHARLLHLLSPEVMARSVWLALGAVGVHTASMLMVTAAVAVVVYEKLGLALLRHAWFNLDLLWAAALLLASVSTLVWH
jgi:hypothetical protein